MMLLMMGGGEHGDSYCFAQVGKGEDLIQALMKELNGRASRDKLTELSSQYYTAIPHRFGRQRPPVLDSLAAISVCLSFVDDRFHVCLCPCVHCCL
jgi:hypothetical protein